MSQKIVIPKGLINPYETTIIEIPEQVKNVETVVAKPIFEDEYKEDELYEKCQEHSKVYREEMYDTLASLPNEQNIKYIQEEIEEYCEAGEVHDEYVQYCRPHLKSAYNICKPPSDAHMKPKRYRSYYGIADQQRPRPKISENSTSLINWKSMEINRSKDISESNNAFKETYGKKISQSLSHLASIPSKDVIRVLDVMDTVELNKLQKNLREYQAARRKLLYETTNLNTIEDISATLQRLNDSEK